MADTRIDLTRYLDLIESAQPIKRQGSVCKVVGLTIEAQGVNGLLGELCYLCLRSDGLLPAEIVGFRDGRTLLMPLGDTHGIQPGSTVIASGSLLTVPAGPRLLGRVLDGLGRPLDGKGPVQASERYPITNEAPHPLRRTPITQIMPTGVRAIDGLLTCGAGQRIGIFAGSGVGKSTLLGMIARNSRSDISVIGLIGERGREVQEFIDRDLGPEGMRRSVVVVSTSDEPPLVRMKGALVATAVAEYFRDQGLHVTFLMDSVTRFAMAQREVGLAIGEPPATRGYTPSVFAALPKLMERAGTSDRGTITGFYTVLVEGDDFTEPVTDTARSVLDGHIVLSRDLAAEDHYPPIDISSSVSRLMNSIVSDEHRRAAAQVRECIAVYSRARDLVDIGAYQPGSNADIDRALTLMPRITAFLRQQPEEATPYDETLSRLRSIFED
ncbi:MAG: FliI/YscN family ATPase [Anaerolineae bacterium]|nr:FliI/YscN family ATPase [Anaerolineae bacterium]